MLDRITLLLSARALAKECRRASEAQNLPRLIQHADALRAVTREIDQQDDDGFEIRFISERDVHQEGVA